MMTGCPRKGGLAEEAGMLYHASQVHVRIHRLDSVPADSAHLAARDAVTLTHLLFYAVYKLAVSRDFYAVVLFIVLTHPDILSSLAVVDKSYPGPTWMIHYILNRRKRLAHL